MWFSRGTKAENRKSNLAEAPKELIMFFLYLDDK